MQYNKRPFSCFLCCTMGVINGYYKFGWYRVTTPQWLIDWVVFNIPLNTSKVIPGTGFYGWKDPTDSVKALKEVVVPGIGFNPTRSTSPCYSTHACNSTCTKMNQCTEKWAQRHKSQSREWLCLFICVCIALCTILHRTDLIIFPLILQTIY